MQQSYPSTEQSMPEGSMPSPVAVHTELDGLFNNVPPPTAEGTHTQAARGALRSSPVISLRAPQPSPAAQHCEQPACSTTGAGEQQQHPLPTAPLHLIIDIFASNSSLRGLVALGHRSQPIHFIVVHYYIFTCIQSPSI